MRRTGATTRLIDEAIQKLFTYGYIVVPSKNMINDQEFLHGRNDEHLMIIDDEWDLNHAVQNSLYDKIVTRLKVEHIEQYYLGKGRVIRLKQVE